MPLTPSAEQTCCICYRACTRDPTHQLRWEAPPATRDSVLCCRARAPSGSSGRHPRQPEELRFHISPQPSAPAGTRYLRFGLSPLDSPSKGGLCVFHKYWVLSLDRFACHSLTSSNRCSFCAVDLLSQFNRFTRLAFTSLQQRVFAEPSTCSRNCFGQHVSVVYFLSALEFLSRVPGHLLSHLGRSNSSSSSREKLIPSALVVVSRFSSVFSLRALELLSQATRSSRFSSVVFLSLLLGLATDSVKLLEQSVSSPPSSSSRE
jgi:hypothetical protein